LLDDRTRTHWAASANKTPFLPLAKIRALRQVCVTIWQKSFLWTQWEIEI
jgi:hypothetical protein